MNSRADQCGRMVWAPGDCHGMSFELATQHQCLLCQRPANKPRPLFNGLLVCFHPCKGQVQGGGLCPVCSYNDLWRCPRPSQQHLSLMTLGFPAWRYSFAELRRWVAVLPPWPSGCPWDRNKPALGSSLPLKRLLLTKSLSDLWIRIS